MSKKFVTPNGRSAVAGLSLQARRPLKGPAAQNAQSITLILGAVQNALVKIQLGKVACLLHKKEKLAV